MGLERSTTAGIQKYHLHSFTILTAMRAQIVSFFKFRIGPPPQFYNLTNTNSYSRHEVLKMMKRITLLSHDIANMEKQ